MNAGMGLIRIARPIAATDTHIATLFPYLNGRVHLQPLSILISSISLMISLDTLDNAAIENITSTGVEMIPVEAPSRKGAPVSKPIVMLPRNPLLFNFLSYTKISMTDIITMKIGRAALMESDAIQDKMIPKDKRTPIIPLASFSETRPRGRGLWGCPFLSILTSFRSFRTLPPPVIMKADSAKIKISKVLSKRPVLGMITEPTTTAPAAIKPFRGRRTAR